MPPTRHPVRPGAEPDPRGPRLLESAGRRSLTVARTERVLERTDKTQERLATSRLRIADASRKLLEAQLRMRRTRPEP